MFSGSFHQYSWNSEVETTWKSLICWQHRMSNIYLNRDKSQNYKTDFWHWKLTLKIKFWWFLSPHTQVNASPITKIISWLKFLGKNLHLVGCATVCGKSEVMLLISMLFLFLRWCETHSSIAKLIVGRNGVHKVNTLVWPMIWFIFVALSY